MAREITDLHGNKFKVGDYKLCLNIPITGKGNLVFTRDLISGEPFNLSVSKKKYKGYFYNLSLNLYVRFDLEYMGYDESSDIRKSHLYVRKGNKRVRFPRPMGTTAMALEYQKNPNDELLIKIHNYIINQWLMGNGVLCGITYDINTFSYRMGIDINYIRVFMRDRLLSSRIWDKEKAEDLLQALMGEQLAWALEDRMEIAHQVNILRESQGGKYVPFISAELGKALKLKLESSTSLQSIVRNLTGGSTTNIFAQFNQQNNVTQQNAITVEEARQIVLESQRVLDKPEEAKLLEDRYDIKSLPEVVATKQEGVDTSKEGLNLNKAELMQITDDYKGAMSSFSKEHHELRREIEMRIDPDEEDPELYQYEDFEEEEKEDGSFASQFLRNSKLP